MIKRIFKNLLFVFILLNLSSSLITASGNKGDSKPLVARRVSPAVYVKSSEDMVVTFIDVGQGNCILVETPSGIALLYDAGGTPEWMESSWDPGIKVVVPYLKANRVTKVEYAVMSHAHDDHIAGFRAVMDNIEIGEFIDPGYPHPGIIYGDLLEIIKTKNIKYKIMRAGDGNKIELGPDITCEIFSPPADFYYRGTNSDVNNSSLLLKITYKNVSFLFPGDLEKQGELYCAKKYGNRLTANILQAGHHGSFTSSTKPFLQKVLPEVAIIPVGKNNRYGHPRPEALNNLENVGAEIYRTDYDGNVIIYTDGKTFMVETEK